MSHNILITGGSGYLGGTVLARWQEAKLPPYQSLFAAVRTEEQATSVTSYGAKPLRIDTNDESSIFSAITDHDISIVYYLIGVIDHSAQVHMIKALAEVKDRTGRDVHFLQTSGAKVFSSHAGFPTNGPVPDTEPGLYDIQKNASPPHAVMLKAVETNVTIIDTAETYGVRSYIFIPCIVYGKGEGFGNVISIQTVAIVKAAKKIGAVYKPETGRLKWPVCHIVDNTRLYLNLLRQILSGAQPDHGRKGHYLASSGSIAWEDIYAGMAKALAKRGLVKHDRVEEADDTILQRMGDALACPKEAVTVQLGGRCDLITGHGQTIGWKSQYAAEHILETADTEVELILAHLKD